MGLSLVFRVLWGSGLDSGFSSVKPASQRHTTICDAYEYGAERAKAAATERKP